ncbi:MAG: haloacid dehalogenase type II [Beijerinckiaceae bacterium]
MTIRAYAFDAYGTLFNVHAAIGRHREAIGEDADALSALWRIKQLEYSWMRTMMGRYKDFWTLTQEALDFCLARYPDVDKALRPKLLDAYWRLDAYDDVLPALTRLRRMGHTIAIFTNGTKEMAEGAANASAVLPIVDMIVSVDDIGQFKTVPAVYQHLCDRLDMKPQEVCLVSSNRWDIAGGVAFGLRSIWVNRTGMPDEYFDAQPDKDVKGLTEIG